MTAKLEGKRVVRASMGAQHAGCITYLDAQAGSESVFSRMDAQGSLYIWGAGNPQVN
jgi:hypothetical protein